MRACLDLMLKAMLFIRNLWLRVALGRFIRGLYRQSEVHTQCSMWRPCTTHEVKSETHASTAVHDK